MLIPPENVPSDTVGAPSSGCSSTSKAKSSSASDRARELVDRVLAQVRHRPVRGLPARHRVRPHDALVRHARVVRGRLGHQHRAAAAQQRRRRPPAPARPRSPSPHPRTARARGPRTATRRRDASRSAGDDDRRRPALHVARAAPEQAVAVGLARERVDRPVGLAQRHRVEVAGQAQRRPLVRHAPAGDQRGAPRVELVRLDREPGRLQPRPDQRRGLAASSPGGLIVRVATSSRVSSTTGAATGYETGSGSRSVGFRDGFFGAACSPACSAPRPVSERT